jgi:outer membrane beta-barrel protein
MDLKSRHFAGTPARFLGKLGLFLAVAASALAPVAAWADDAKGDPLYSGNQPIDRELDKYWNAEQKVQSLQNPMYERKGGFEAALHFGMVPNDSFYFPKAVGGNLSYFFTDTVAVEASFSYLFNDPSKLQTFLTAAPVGNNGSKNLTANSKQVPMMNWLSSLDVAWSPFHGKIGIFATKLSNFDLGFVGGLGLIGARIDTSDHSEATPNANLESQIKPAAHWGASLRFYATRWLNLRADYRQFMYWPDAGKPFLAPVEFTLGVAFLTK